MSKYKVGDKVVMEIMRVDDGVDLMNVGSCGCSWCIPASQIDRMSEPLSTYTEPLEAKIKNLKKKLKKWVEKGVNQRAEITRLLAENKELKDKLDNRCDMCIERHEKEVEQARAEGRQEAWELARKLSRMEIDDKIQEAFNLEYSFALTVIEQITYPEAAEKVSKWEKAKEEIKVGDIFQDNDGNNAIITSIKGNTVYYMWDDGDTRSGFAEDVKKHFTKTGRHIDIDSFLKQIGGKENEGNL